MADGYGGGESERMPGVALRDYERAHLVIATKCWLPTDPAVTARQLDILDRQLASNEFIGGAEYTIADRTSKLAANRKIKEGPVPHSALAVQKEAD